jgi:hypothetical protein
MRRYTLHMLVVGAIALASFGHSGRTTGEMAQGPSTAKYPDFDTLVRGAKECDGLFKMYHKDGQLFAELKPNQFEQPFLCPIAIARGMAQGGHTLNFDEQWVLVFRRVGDRVFLIRRNVHFQARSSLPVAKAVETTYMDSVLMSLRIQSVHPIRGSVLLNFNDIFMTDFAQLGRGHFDSSRSTWHKIKAFPRNVEIQVAATYAGGRSGDSVIDGRGTTVVIHYGLCQLPEPGYTPRLADDRVGHFLSVVKDYSNDTKATPFTRYVNRWRLERADGSSWKEGGKLVPPKKKIVFWIEKSVPDEYRAYVRDGILEWNKAYAKIGFRDAIEVRQQENEDFDPEDSNYNTFRWITSDRGFAMGPSRANPLTGEIFDADIIFDASMVRYYRNDASVFGGSAATNDISPIRAQQKGIGLSSLDMSGGNDPEGWDSRPGKKLDPFTKDRARAISNGLCECGPCLKRELNLLAMAVMLRDNAAGPPTSTGGILPEDLIGQAIKEVTMHEVGHTLGLRHNFKSSTMLDNKDLHNTAITRVKGLVGSVMDYAPVNLAPKGVKQGDYFTTTLGPYDYWVIEYAYRPLGGGTDGEVDELKKIASKCATPGLAFATDEDLFTSSDPYVNTWDLGSDPMKFAQDRILLAEELLAKLADKGADKGEGYQKTRQSFATLLREYGNGAFLVSKFIGGVSMHRDHVGDPAGRDPLVVVAPEKQRAALKFVQEHILTDKPFQFSPKLLRQLATDRWMHWGTYNNMMTSVEYPVHERVLAIQRVVLEHALDGGTLSRIQNNALRHDKDQKVKPFELSELFRGLTDGIWGDMAADKKVELGIVKRNLQREYLKDLIQMVLTGSSAPADARSLARLHLRDIAKRIDAVLGNANVGLDDTSKAHLQESKERIAKALNATLNASES